MRLNKEKINKNFKEKIKIKKEIIDSIKKNEWKKKIFIKVKLILKIIILKIIQMLIFYLNLIKTLHKNYLKIFNFKNILRLSFFN